MFVSVIILGCQGNSSPPIPRWPLRRRRVAARHCHFPGLSVSPSGLNIGQFPNAVPELGSGLIARCPKRERAGISFPLSALVRMSLDLLL